MMPGARGHAHALRRRRGGRQRRRSSPSRAASAWSATGSAWAATTPPRCTPDLHRAVPLHRRHDRQGGRRRLRRALRRPRGRGAGLVPARLTTRRMARDDGTDGTAGLPRDVQADRGDLQPGLRVLLLPVARRSCTRAAGSGCRRTCTRRTSRQLLAAQRGVDEVVVAFQGGEPTLMGIDFFRRTLELERAVRGARAADPQHDADQRHAARRRVGARSSRRTTSSSGSRSTGRARCTTPTASTRAASRPSTG